MKVSIETLSESNQKYFEVLNREWLEKYFRVEAVDQDYFDDPIKMVIEPGGQIFFARRDEQVIGTCSVLKQDEGYELAKMAVTEKVQGLGVGQLLIDHCIEFVKTQQAKRLFLITNSQLKPAINLYLKSGFKIIFEGQHPKYDRGDVVMELTL